MSSPRPQPWVSSVHTQQPVKRAKDVPLSPRWGFGYIAPFSHGLRRGLSISRPVRGWTRSCEATASDRERTAAVAKQLQVTAKEQPQLRGNCK